MERIELSTSPLPRVCSTTEPHGQTLGLPMHGAGDGSRTRNPQLGRLILYQLSYSR